MADLERIVQKVSRKAVVLGEYGGISVLVKDHVWMNPDAPAWSYEVSEANDLPKHYFNLVDGLRKLEAQGLTALIYTG